VNFSIGVDAIIALTASQFGVRLDEYVEFRSGATGRKIVVQLCRRYTRATLRELSEGFVTQAKPSLESRQLIIEQSKVHEPNHIS